MAKDYKALKRNLKGSKSPSIRPLPMPSRGRGLSLGLIVSIGSIEGAKSIIEYS
jgi:hypothetical protein